MLALRFIAVVALAMVHDAWAQDDVRVLCLNTALMPELMLQLVNQTTWDQSSNAEQVSRIVAFVRSLSPPPDILVFQEVWGATATTPMACVILGVTDCAMPSRAELVLGLQEIYPYSTQLSEESPSRRSPSRAMDSGLLTLSRTPICREEFWAFSDCSALDCLSQKGILEAVTVINNRAVRILNTHMDAGSSSDGAAALGVDIEGLVSTMFKVTPSDNATEARRLQLEQLHSVAVGSTEDEVTIVAGDFNIYADANSEQYRVLTEEKFSRDKGWLEASSAVNYTNSHGKLDYIFVRFPGGVGTASCESTAGMSFADGGVDVVVQPDGAPVSDHLGLLGTFAFAPSTVLPCPSDVQSTGTDPIPDDDMADAGPNMTDAGNGLRKGRLLLCLAAVAWQLQ